MHRLRLWALIIGGVLLFIVAVRVISSCAGKEKLRKPLDTGPAMRANPSQAPQPASPKPTASYGPSLSGKETRVIKRAQLVRFTLPLDKRMGRWTLAPTNDDRIKPINVYRVNARGRNEPPFKKAIITVRIYGEGKITMRLIYLPDDYSTKVLATRDITFYVRDRR